MKSVEVAVVFIVVAFSLQSSFTLLTKGAKGSNVEKAIDINCVHIEI